MSTIEVINAGCTPFGEAESWQQRLAAERESGKRIDTLLLLEHPPVITRGRRDSSEDLLVTSQQLQSRGIDFIETDRGGRMTYHGPGQLVGYFIFKLGGRRIPGFVRLVEEVVIRVLRTFNLEGARDPQYPGVWIKNRKVAALGLHFERGVSRHGFALNVDCDLNPFELFHPCGIRDRGVTSMTKELGASLSLDEVKQRVIRQVEELF